LAARPTAGAAPTRGVLADLRLVEIHQTPIVDDGVTATLTARLARHSTDDSIGGPSAS
jgi:hypothetical protein